MLKYEIKKAVKEQLCVKIALMGSSGSGKTYSALRLATGMKSELDKVNDTPSKIVMINTEEDRGKYYANEFEYDILDLRPPYSPENYIEALDFVKESGYSIVILDSISPEWEGTGGCLELHQLAGGQWADWRKVTPRHEKFIEALIKTPVHIIATIKGKDQYEVEKDKDGKSQIKKLGVGSKQREGLEYNLTCTFNIDQKTNVADAQKDNTHIFQNNVGTILSEKYGEKLIQWANDGKVIERAADFKYKSPEQREEEERLFNNVKETIKNFAVELHKNNMMDKYTYIVNTRLGEGRSVKDATIEDLEKLVVVAEDLKEIEIK